MIAMSAASMFISELLAAPPESVDHWIADDLWDLGSGLPAMLAYLAGVMSMHPPVDRAYEVAAEVLRLLVGGAKAVVQ
ncbi:hypothetical protein [Nocardia sp. CA-290969]|uniref:hypothetical protein n=1 Tax=Nocardia sp. CA-290969 TaxID=3239986 RepID=UPI003D90FBE8